jgi:hypothetical protein
VIQFFRLFALAALAVLCGSCATTPQPSGPPPVLARLKAMGINDATYQRIAAQRVLSYDDILGLVKKGVPSPVILTYVQSTRAPYTLTNAQLQALVDAGASAELVNHLGRSVGFFEATERGQTGDSGQWRNEPFFNDPFYFGPAPFPYAWPDEWYDDGWINGVF